MVRIRPLKKVLLRTPAGHLDKSWTGVHLQATASDVDT